MQKSTAEELRMHGKHFAWLQTKCSHCLCVTWKCVQTCKLRKSGMPR